MDQTSARGSWQVVMTKNEPQRKWGPCAVMKDNKFWVYGGCLENGNFTGGIDVYNLDTALWTQAEVKNSGPCSRHFASAVVLNGALHVFGGKSNGYHNDLYKFQTESLRWEYVRFDPKMKCPQGVFGHSAVVLDQKMYIFGGYDGHGFTLDDLWEYDDKFVRWTRVNARGKDTELNRKTLANFLPRYHHSAVVHQRSMYVFGGKGEKEPLCDLLEFHFDSLTWTRVSTVGSMPSSRHGHSAAVVGDNMYIFGGVDLSVNTTFGDLYSYNFGSRRWQRIDTPLSCPARYFHSMIAHDRSLYVFGGKNVNDSDFMQSGLHAFNIEDAMLTRSVDSVGESGSTISTASHIGIGVVSSSTGMRSSKTKIRLKCHFDGEIRLMSVDPEVQYTDLMKQLVDEYALPLRIQYQDDEGDMITVRSQADLEEALAYCESQKITALKVHLTAAQSRDSSFAISAPSSASSTMFKRFSNPPGGVISPLAALAIAPTNPTNSSSPHHSPQVASRLATHSPKGSAKQEISWQKGNLLDSGAFGKVFLGMNSATGEFMAVKEFPLSGLAGEDAAVQNLQKEIDLMRPLHHPNIVRYLGSERTASSLNIFLEYVAGGSIASLLRKFQRFSDSVVKSYLRQVVTGLDFLHRKNIAHRDIKGANILVDISGVVKLADFGTSKQLRNLATGTDQCRTVTGTPYYMAPEVIQGNTRYGRKADIWSVGAVVIEMSTGFPPFHDLAPVAAIFKIGSPNTLPDIPASLSPECKDFMNCCFQRDPKLRSSSSQLLAHPFIAQASAAGVMSAAAKDPDMFTFRAQPTPLSPTSPAQSTLPPTGALQQPSMDSISSLNENEIVSFLKNSQSIISLEFAPLK